MAEREITVQAQLEALSVEEFYRAVPVRNAGVRQTSVTDGLVLHGVRYHGDKVDTQSMVLRYETGTKRIIKTEHRIK